MKKKYKSLGMIYRTVNITINGVIKVIPFSGGTRYPEKKCGFYITSDEEEQKQLENHKGLGRKFIFEKEIVTPSTRKPAVVIMDKAEVPENVEIPVNEPEVIETKERTGSRDDEAIDTEEVVETAPEETTVEEIFEIEKVQDAKEYLMKRFEGEFTHRHLSNKTKVFEVAKEKNIKFPNIK